MHVKIKYLVAAVGIMVGTVLTTGGPGAKAESCPELRIVFARGSGEARWEDQNYINFRDRIDEKLESTGIRYEFVDLDYPAVGIGVEKLGVTLGAFFSGGEAYEFGKSVNAGVDELARMVNGGACPETKYVLGGYSQGAMAVSKALTTLNADRVVYAATFGDPKLYLPEGAGVMPKACRGANLSDYRMYVPDCYAYKGLLGAYQPYEPEDFMGKVGTWCNKRDVLCSSHLSVSDHVAYVSDNLYEDASRVIVGKVTERFGIVNEYTSPHDTAILIDSTGSMEWLIGAFKTEAVRLASETFEAGGRVALYDYRDLDDPYEPVARCNFDACTPENFQSLLDEIVVYGGGDTEESLLSASVKAMNELSWQPYATKSLVVLTDAPFLSPDRDGTTIDEVVALSKRIDPVNMYIVTVDYVLEDSPEVAELAEATGGFATAELGELNLLTDYIMERYDTLPRVEEALDESEIPDVAIDEMHDDFESVTLKLSGSMTEVIVGLGDALLGRTSERDITITGLDRAVENTLRLIPINDSRKGEVVEIVMPKVVERVIEVPVEVEKVIEVEKVVEVPVEKIVEWTLEVPAEKMTEVKKVIEATADGYGGVPVPRTPDTGAVN